MESVRSLLLFGNEKLSESAAHFDLPAIRTCPGRSKLCSEKCYALRGRYRFPQVQQRLQWAFEQAKRRDFVDRMVEELYRRGVLLMRWHCAGDVFSPAYARKMLEVIGRSPHTTFWAYTRSWRVPAIYPVLKAIAMMPNMTLWFSADSETGYPVEVPDHAKVCWMQTEREEEIELAELVFLDHPLRKERIPLGMIDKICPAETPEGKTRGTTCATCRYCWR